MKMKRAKATILSANKGSEMKSWKKKNLHVLTRSRFPTKVDQASETREKAHVREKPKSCSVRRRRFEKEKSASGRGRNRESFFELSLIHNKESFPRGIYLIIPSYNTSRERTSRNIKSFYFFSPCWMKTCAFFLSWTATVNFFWK